MLVETLDLTMSHVGLGALNEYAALVLFANAHSRRLVEGTGLRPDGIADHQGRLLYPAYYHTRLTVPPQRPLGSFKVWDRVAVGVDITRFGKTLLQSRYALGEAGAVPEDASQWTPDTLPRMEAHSVFVVDASENLGPKRRVATPAKDRVAALPPVTTPPAAIERANRIRAAGFGLKDNLARDDSPFAYEVAMIRDVYPGHGMIFAKFCEIMSEGERRYLAERLSPGLPRDALDCVELLEREIFYYGNCFEGETVDIRVKAAFETCPADFHGDNPQLVSAGRLAFETSLYRRRTRELLAVGHAQKWLAVPTSAQELAFDITRITTAYLA